MALSGPVVAAAATTVGSILLLNVLGIVMARFPRHPSKKIGPSGVITQQLLAPLSSLISNILLPCLIFFSLGSRLTPHVLKEAWPSALWALVNILLSVIVAAPLARLLVPRSHWREFVVTSSFSNVGFMPLVMMEVLCDQELLSDEEECFARGVTFIFVHVFMWSITFWTLGVAVIKTFPTEAGVSASAIHGSLTRTMVRGLLSPPILACVAGAVVGLVEPLRRVFFGSSAPLQFVASAASTYGATATGLAMLVMAATLSKSLSSFNPLVWFRCAGRCCLRAEGQAYPNCGIDADNASLHDQHKNQEQEAQEGPYADANERKPALINGVNADTPRIDAHEHVAGSGSSGSGDSKLGNSACVGSLDNQHSHARVSESEAMEMTGVGQDDDDREQRGNGASHEHGEGAAEGRGEAGAGGAGGAGGSETLHQRYQQQDRTAQEEELEARRGEEGSSELVEGWSAGTTVLFLVITLGLVPVLRFGLLVLVGDMVFIGRDVMLLQLVLALQSVTPASTLTVVVCQREDKIRSAQHVSRAVVSQYCCALATLLVGTTLAMSTFYTS